VRVEPLIAKQPKPVGIWELWWLFEAGEPGNRLGHTHPAGPDFNLFKLDQVWSPKSDSVDQSKLSVLEMWSYFEPRWKTLGTEQLPYHLVAYRRIQKKVMGKLVWLDGKGSDGSNILWTQAGLHVDDLIPDYSNCISNPIKKFFLLPYSTL